MTPDKTIYLNSRSRSLPMVERLRGAAEELSSGEVANWLLPLVLYFAGMAFAYGVMKLIEWVYPILFDIYEGFVR